MYVGVDHGRHDPILVALQADGELACRSAGVHDRRVSAELIDTSAQEAVDGAGRPAVRKRGMQLSAAAREHSSVGSSIPLQLVGRPFTSRDRS